MFPVKRSHSNASNAESLSACERSHIAHPLDCLQLAAFIQGLNRVSMSFAIPAVLNARTPTSEARPSISEWLVACLVAAGESAFRHAPYPSMPVRSRMTELIPLSIG